MLFAPFRPREPLSQVLAGVGTLPMPNAQCPKQARANLASRPFRGEQPQARCVNCFCTGGLRSATQVTLGGTAGFVEFCPRVVFPSKSVVWWQAHRERLLDSPPGCADVVGGALSLQIPQVLRHALTQWWVCSGSSTHVFCLCVFLKHPENNFRWSHGRLCVTQ